MVELKMDPFSLETVVSPEVVLGLSQQVSKSISSVFINLVS